MQALRGPQAAGARVCIRQSNSMMMGMSVSGGVGRYVAAGRHVSLQVQPAAASTCQFRKQLRTKVKTSAQSSNAANNSDWSSKPAEEKASTSQPSADSSSSPQQEPQENSMLAIPLLIGSSLSHINKQYIKMRRRRKWWSKMGGYPKVPSESMDHLPEPAVQLWQKVVPLGLIFFCASFNLTILQSLKDAIMVTAGGAEALPYLASFCVLPASVAFFVLYGKLVAHLPERAVFYASVVPLLVYYAIFATVLYPIAPTLHPLDLMHKMMTSVPAGLHGLLKVAGNWTYSLFFCMAELWGAVVISVLFWSLANEVCTVEEAKAVYPFMAIGANIALVAAGCFIRLVNHTLSTTVGGDTQLLSLRVLIGTVMAMTAAMFASKGFIDAKILGPAAKAAAAVAAGDGSGQQKAMKKKKSKGSFSEGIAVLKNSPKIRNLALLVMSYGVGHRLFEFAWKGQLRALYPTVQGYQSVLADVATYTGMLTLASMVVSRLVFQYAGWGVAASVTPAVMGLAGVVFFAGTLAAGMPMLSTEAAATMAGVGATAGVVTQVFARAAKYSLFDPAKEMVYIEMDADEKKQGKAAVDLVGSQIGKSGASWITQAFLLGCGSIAAAMPFTGVIFAGVIITWLKATFSLHRQMQETERVRLAEQKAAAAASIGSSPGGPGGPAAAAAVAAAGGEFTESDDLSDTSSHQGNGDLPGHIAAGSASAGGSGSHASSTSFNAHVAAAMNGQLTNGGSSSSSQARHDAHAVNGDTDGLNGGSSSSSSNAAKEFSKLKLQ